MLFQRISLVLLTAGLLFNATFPALAAEHDVDGAHKVVTVESHRSDVIVVSGLDNRVTVHGSCRKIVVSGTDNRVNVQGFVRTVKFDGLDNLVTYSRALCKHVHPHAGGLGAGNHVKETR